MKTFNRGETVICSIEIKDADGNFSDPATSTQITITDPSGTDVVDDQAMTKDSIGKYHYDYTSSSSAKLGNYLVKYVLTDGSRITIDTETFKLEQ